MLSGVTRQQLWGGSSRPSNNSSSTDPKPSLPGAAAEKERGLYHNDDRAPLDDAPLDHLNACLATLVSIFPHVKPEVFRELLCNFKEESRLNLVVEALLKDKERWVRGRWRTTEEDGKGMQTAPEQRPLTDGDRPLVRVQDNFRSNEYKTVVESVLRQEFKGIGRAVVRAVMAENNHCYTDSRSALVRMASKSWKFSLTSFITRRKLPSLYDETLVRWHISPDGEVNFVLRPTASVELNEELQSTIVTPIWQQRRDQQIGQDRALAIEINDAEAEAAEATFECQTCYMTQTFETTTACSEGHFICFRCIRHTVNEALFGQGWARVVDPAKLALRCIASVSDEPDCHGRVSQQLLRSALLSETDSESTWLKFEEMAALECLVQSKLLFVKCPFCPWAEERDPPDIHRPFPWIGTISKSHLCSVLLVVTGLLFVIGLLLKYLPRVAIPIFLITFFRLIAKSRDHNSDVYTYIVKPLTHRPASEQSTCGVKFTCRNPACGRASCLRCSEAWIDIHTCFESSRLALRQHVEAAQAEAIKRTCPRCSTSFIKASGCNKLVCPCGYKMCYLCRKELHKTMPYSHFCAHFKPTPGPCGQCNACELYKNEDEDEVVRLAGVKAEREWLEREERERGTRNVAVA